MPGKSMMPSLLATFEVIPAASCRDDTRIGNTGALGHPHLCQFTFEVRPRNDSIAAAISSACVSSAKCPAS